MSAITEPVLLKQYKLLGAVIDASWATRLDHKIARHVIDKFYVKFGNARASLRYLEVATGAKRNKIIPSTAKASRPHGERTGTLQRSMGMESAATAYCAIHFMQASRFGIAFE